MRKYTVVVDRVANGAGTTTTTSCATEVTGDRDAPSRA